MFTLLAQAASNNTIDIRSQATTISKMTDFSVTFEGILRVLLYIGALIAFAYMVWGGLDWILSQGDTGKVETARKKITQSVIGLVVLASVGALFWVVQTFLGLSILK
jgi:TRAP-type C4-dicarboxylate transport system permease small subunit